jgi:hypothetical protein
MLISIQSLLNEELLELALISLDLINLKGLALHEVPNFSFKSNE